jgi:hypothetical protein
MTRRLAVRARDLVDGMRSRCGRDPDYADFQAAFNEELFGENDSLTAYGQLFSGDSLMRKRGE